jgi:hypothetical protein
MKNSGIADSTFQQLLRDKKMWVCLGRINVLSSLLRENEMHTLINDGSWCIANVHFATICDAHKLTHKVGEHVPCRCNPGNANKRAMWKKGGQSRKSDSFGPEGLSNRWGTSYKGVCRLQKGPLSRDV